MHGGKAVAGIASGRFTTGKYSKYLPERMLAAYHETQADETLLALRDEIRLVDARLVDLLARVDTGESGALWQELQETYRGYKAALAGKENGMDAATWLFGLGELILRGTQDYAAWGEIHKVIEQRRRLAESERKHLVEAQQTITAQQAMVLISQLSRIVLDHVSDPKTRTAISTEFIRLLGPATSTLNQ